MKNWTRITTLVLAMGILSVGGRAIGATPAASPNAMAEIEQFDRAYEAAFNKGDAAALASLFAEDVEYTNEDGVLVQGREQIESLLKKTLAQNAGATMAIEIESVKFPTPETALERGTTLTTSANGEMASSAYLAVYVRKDGKWQIQQLVDMPTAEPSPAEQLSELAWMIGSWQEKDGDIEVKTKVQWARGSSFMTRTFEVTNGGEVTMEGWQIIGWDPVEERIRSWLFDSGGAFAESVWTRSGSSWLIRQIGVLPDGSQTSSDNALVRVNDDTCYWEITNRTLDGDPLPNQPRVEMVRVKEQ